MLTAYSKDLLEGSSVIGMISVLLVLGLAGGVGGWSCGCLDVVTGTPLAVDGPLVKISVYLLGKLIFLIVSLDH